MMGAIGSTDLFQTIRPGHLVPGDVVMIHGGAFEVLSEPFAGASGTSLFDSSALFWRVRVRLLGDRATVGYVTWDAGEEVWLLNQ
jgi:hypothetical protein